MSWECPYLHWYEKDGRTKNICKLNGKDCTPARDRCVLKNRFATASDLSKPSDERTSQ